MTLNQNPVGLAPPLFFYKWIKETSLTRQYFSHPDPLFTHLAFFLPDLT
jgi:hypothetical protein